MHAPTRHSKAQIVRRSITLSAVQTKKGERSPRVVRSVFGGLVPKGSFTLTAPLRPGQDVSQQLPRRWRPSVSPAGRKNARTKTDQPLSPDKGGSLQDASRHNGSVDCSRHGAESGSSFRFQLIQVQIHDARFGSSGRPQEGGGGEGRATSSDGKRWRLGRKIAADVAAAKAELR